MSTSPIDFALPRLQNAPAPGLVPAPSVCPSATLRNDLVKLTLQLPDEKIGFYRGARFERSGMVTRAEWDGHVFFGPWNQAPSDPYHHDNVQGTAEEFSMDDPPGFADAAVGEPFLKIGVGLLRRPSADAYGFFNAHTIDDAGRWEVTANDRGDAIVFEHTIRGAGWGYRYRKQVELIADEPGFTIQRSLENTGSRAIDTLHYGHHFINIDGQRIGAGWLLRLPYDVIVKDSARLNGHVALNGRTATITRPIPRGETVWCEFVANHDLQSAPGEFTMTVADPAGKTLRIDLRPAPEFVRLFATPMALCPEGFVRVHADPGQTCTWSSRYVFSATP